MHELWIAAAAFATGCVVTGATAYWHQRQLRKARAAESQKADALANRLSAQRDRLAEDLRFAENQAAGLRAQLQLTEAHDQGYLEGMQHGAEMDDVERMAYNLDHKRPGRVIRMAQYRDQMQGVQAK